MLAQLTQTLPSNGNGATLDHRGLLALPGGPSSWLLAAALLFAPLTAVRLPGFSHLGYCDAFFCMAVLAGVVERFAQRDFVYKKSTFIAALVYIFCFIGLSASYWINYSNKVTVPYGLTHTLGYSGNFLALVGNATIIPLAVFSIRVRSLAEFRFLILVWTMSALFGALFVVAYCNGYITHYDVYWATVGRASGLTPHPNVLAVNTVLALPGLLLFWCSVRSWLIRIAIATGVIVLWQAANLSGSRTALGGLLVVLLVFLVMRSHNRMRGLLAAGGVLGMALVLRELIAAFPGDLSRDSAVGRLIFGAVRSNTVRDALNAIAFHQWVDNPVFGVGYGMARVAHNLYIQILDVAGVVGFIPWLCALGMPLGFLLINGTHQYARNESAAMFSAVIAVLAIAWVQPAITDINSSIVFGLALYLALNPHFQLSDGKRALCVRNVSTLRPTVNALKAQLRT